MLDKFTGKTAAELNKLADGYFIKNIFEIDSIGALAWHERHAEKEKHNYFKGISFKDLKVLEYKPITPVYADYIKKAGGVVSVFGGTDYVKKDLDKNIQQASIIDGNFDVIVCLGDIANIQELTKHLNRFGTLIINKIKPDKFIESNYTRIEQYQYVKTNLNVMMLYNYSRGTTGDFIERAFKKFARVIRPNIKSNGEGIKEIVKANKIDLLLQVDSGGWITIPKNVGCETACYSIDTFNKTEKALEVLKNYNHKFFAQKRFAVNKNEYWLPLGFDADTYKPMQTLIEHDISFCGTFIVRDSQAERNACLKVLNNEQMKGGINFYLGRDYNESACLKYNQSRLVFNMGIANDINMRFFELMGSGAVGLYNNVDGLTDLGFEPNIHYLPFTDKNDVLKTVYKALNDPDTVEKIRETAFVKVMNGHTYKHRVIDMIKTLKL
jgi:hypothetical protein